MNSLIIIGIIMILAVIVNGKNEDNWISRGKVVPPANYDPPDRPPKQPEH